MFGWRPFPRPGLTFLGRRAQPRSRMAAGHRGAARSVLDGGEHGGNLARGGLIFPCWRRVSLGAAGSGTSVRAGFLLCRRRGCRSLLWPVCLCLDLGRVTLLARTANIFGQPLIDDLTEPVQLRPTDRRRPPIPGRNRKPHDLPHAVARYPKVTCRLSPAHAITARKANLPIQFHGENAPALPKNRKGKTGRLLRRPQRGYPAATVANFSTAVLSGLLAHAEAARRHPETPAIGQRRVHNPAHAPAQDCRAHHRDRDPGAHRLRRGVSRSAVVRKPRPLPPASRAVTPGAAAPNPPGPANTQRPPDMV